MIIVAQTKTSLEFNEADTKSSPTDNESEAVVLGKVPSNEEGGEVTLDELQ